MVIDRDRLTKLCNDIPASHRPLAEILQAAARSTISNPSLSLQKSKIALGIIVRDVYEKEMDKHVSNTSVRILLNNKNFIAKVHPRRIYLLMNLVRKMTTSHSNDAVHSKAAKIVLEYLVDICEWYLQRLEDGEKLATSAFYNVYPLQIDKSCCKESLHYKNALMHLKTFSF
mgnify:CR=1 FL=1